VTFFILIFFSKLKTKRLIDRVQKTKKTSSTLYVRFFTFENIFETQNPNNFSSRQKTLRRYSISF